MAMPSGLQPAAMADVDLSLQQEGQEVQLLTAWASPYGQRVELALAVKGIHHETIPQNLVDKSPLLLASNPIHKKVPVLIHRGKAICESSVILQYIDETWPHPHNNLLPPDPYDRAVHRFWGDYVDRKLFDALLKIMRTKGDEQKATVEEAIKCLATLDDALGRVGGGGPFFGGSKLGFVDVILGPFLSWQAAFEAAAQIKFPLEDEFPRLLGWKSGLQRCDASSVLPEPEKVTEFAMNFIRKRFV